NRHTRIPISGNSTWLKIKSKAPINDTLNEINNEIISTVDPTNRAAFFRLIPWLSMVYQTATSSRERVEVRTAIETSTKKVIPTSVPSDPLMLWNSDGKIWKIRSGPAIKAPSWKIAMPLAWARYMAGRMSKPARKATKASVTVT